jgi:hypothetical protein
VSEQVKSALISQLLVSLYFHQIYSISFIFIICFILFKLFPTIYLYWKAYKVQILSKLREEENPLEIAGAGRHDSKGHSAKDLYYFLLHHSLNKTPTGRKLGLFNSA